MIPKNVQDKVEQLSRDSALMAQFGPSILGLEGCVEFIEGLRNCKIEDYWEMEAFLVANNLLAPRKKRTL